MARNRKLIGKDAFDDLADVVGVLVRDRPKLLVLGELMRVIVTQQRHNDTSIE